jgi:RimJ/RimL family protein N-acetyltransferase
MSQESRSRPDGALGVRPLTRDEIGIRIEYFHRSSDEHLARMGVDRALLPDPEIWQAEYDADYERPLEARRTYTLAWLLDDRIVGFSSTDRIAVGEEAFMHLHVIEQARRRRGLGVAFVELSVAHYFDVLALERLYCEPNALNVAPNRTLQRAGFRYVMSHHTTPGPYNPPQVVTRWVVERPGRG